mgnify:CR=1 FL=1
MFLACWTWTHNQILSEIIKPTDDDEMRSSATNVN